MPREGDMKHFFWNNFYTNSIHVSFFLSLFLAYSVPCPVRYVLFNLKIYLSEYFPHDVDGTVGPAASSRIVVSPQEPLTEALSAPKGALFKHRATQTRLSHSCGAEGALNLSQTPPPTPPPLSRWDTPLIKATDCTLCWGELPQTGAHCERRLCGCVRKGWTGRGGRVGGGGHVREGIRGMKLHVLHL